MHCFDDDGRVNDDSALSAKALLSGGTWHGLNVVMALILLTSAASRRWWNSRCTVAWRRQLSCSHCFEVKKCRRPILAPVQQSSDIYLIEPPRNQSSGLSPLYRGCAARLSSAISCCRAWNKYDWPCRSISQGAWKSVSLPAKKYA